MSNTNFGYIQGTPISIKDHKVKDHVITTFTLGVNGKKKADGTYHPGEYFNVVAWNLPEKKRGFIEKQIKKGVFAVTYELKQESWEDKEGQKRSQIKLTALDISYLRDRSDSFTSAPVKREEPVVEKEAETVEPVAFDEDDLPF